MLDQTNLYASQAIDQVKRDKFILLSSCLKYWKNVSDGEFEKNQSC